MDKKLKLFVFLLVVSVLAFTSCNKDDNERIVGGAVVPGNYSGIINGYEYVDLELPSGTLWATCNIGAEDPSEFGDYFAWGETKAKSAYDWSTYIWCKGTSTTLTKYNEDSEYGTVDNKTVLDPEDDAANVCWGGGWRMPTLVEMKELSEHCKWEKVAVKGNEGYRVTGINGYHIFLPAAGYRFGTDLTSTQGFYWTQDLYPTNSSNAYSLFFNFDSVNPQGVYPRFRGYPIRPVCSPKE